MRSFSGPLLLLLSAVAAVYLLGNVRVGLWDRDEPRYAQTSWQMLQTGDWVVPRFLDELRAKKPPLIYWCQASAMAVLGDTAFAARLPSVIAMLLTLALVAEAVRRVVGSAQAIWTAFILASSLWVICLAKVALTDSVLLLWTIIAQIALYRIWRRAVALPLYSLAKAGASIPSPGTPGEGQGGGLPAARMMRGRREEPPPQPSPGVPGEGEMQRYSSLGSAAALTDWIILAIATGLGLLTKGPIVLTLAGTALAMLALDLIDHRRLPRPSARTLLHAVLAIAIIALIVGPWLYLVNQRAPGFLELMKNEARGHVETGMEGHAGWPGEQFLMIWATFMPWSLLLPMAIVIGWKQRASPASRFALAAVIGPWLLVELCIKTKLPHYMLPTFPPLAFLTAGAILHCLDGNQKDAATPAFLFFAGVWAVAVALVGCTPWLAAYWFTNLPWIAMSAVTAAALAYAAFVLIAFHRRRPKHAFIAMGVGMLIVFSLAYGFYLPRANFLRLSIETADWLKSHGATQRGEELMIDYHEPSLAFYQGGTIREQDFHIRKSTFLAYTNRQNWPRWMVITAEVWNATEPASKTLLTRRAMFHGLAYADGGRIEDVMVVEYRPER